MKQISMKDLGCCDQIVTARSDEELKKKLFEHAQKDHPEKLKEMTPEMMKEIDMRIKEFTREV
ncbi:MAG: DUF1059 domain-containing protein [Candidatus Manganitrophus sp. SA1]|nr:DUF1059 domain-containing protein [Candidatus Manganitrophus morganii]